MSALTKPIAFPAGSTAVRPTGVEDGFCYFDTTLGKPVWASSLSLTGWVDHTGADA